MQLINFIWCQVLALCSIQLGFNMYIQSKLL